MLIRRRAFASTLATALAPPNKRLQSAQDPASLVWKLDTIAWQPDDPPGSKYAVLDGDRDAADGLFTYAFLLPEGCGRLPTSTRKLHTSR